MTFILEGTVGSGKSSTLDALRELHPDWIVLEEPVAEWQSYSVEEGVQINFLNDFYAKRSERTFRLLQNQVLLSLMQRYSHAEEHHAGRTIVLERSIEVAKEVFMECNADLARMPEMNQLRDLASWAMTHFEAGIPKIYLTCTPECMLERVISRGRSSESRCNAVELCRLQTSMNKWAERKELFTLDSTYKTPDELAEEISTWHSLHFTG